MGAGDMSAHQIGDKGKACPNCGIVLLRYTYKVYPIDPLDYPGATQTMYPVYGWDCEICHAFYEDYEREDE